MSVSAVPVGKHLAALDDCGTDWILDRAVECASPTETATMAEAMWERQRREFVASSPFHRKRLGDVSPVTLKDIPSLPFTTKRDVADAQAMQPPFGDVLAVPPEQVKRVFQTSGTTGRPTIVALTAADMATWVKVGTRSYFATGLHAHDSVLMTMAAGPFVAGLTHQMVDTIGARSVPVPPTDNERIITAVEQRLVDTLFGTASYALRFARLCSERGLDAHANGLKHVVAGGEPGAGVPAIRRQIEEELGVYVTESMGNGDVCTSMFSECPLQQGMHFCAQDAVWPEIVDPETGEPLAFEPGVVGELVYTSLAREATPVVRFRSADIAEVLGTSCACGRTGFRLRVLGRSDDMFIVRGVNVYPAAVQAVVAELRPHVTGRARVVLPVGAVNVEPPVRVEVEVPDDSAADPVVDGTALHELLDRRLRDRLTFRTQVVLLPEREFAPAGYKTKAVVRR